MTARAGRWLAVVALLGASAASAQERWDHRGAVGLVVATGGELRTSFAGLTPQAGGGGVVDVGTSVAIGHDGNEVQILARLGYGGADLGAAILGGYRGYFGADRWKTFVDLGGALHVRPDFAIGPRVGVGVQYELAPVVGAFAGAAAQLAVGGGLRFSGELIVGLQLRSYLLE